MTSRDDDWWKDMGRCVLEGYIECAAEVPAACMCRRMPELVYEEMHRRKYDHAEHVRKEE